MILPLKCKWSEHNLIEKVSYWRVWPSSKNTNVSLMFLMSWKLTFVFIIGFLTFLCVERKRAFTKIVNLGRLGTQKNLHTLAMLMPTQILNCKTFEIAQNELNEGCASCNITCVWQRNSAAKRTQLRLPGKLSWVQLEALMSCKIMLKYKCWPY